MFLCPNCNTGLSRVKRKYGSVWTCPKCWGEAANISLLREFVERQPLNELWRAALRSTKVTARACPACRRAMIEVPMPTEGGRPVLDICKRCQFIWFDRSEMETMPVVIPELKGTTAPRELPTAARQILAEYEVNQIAEQSRHPGYGEEPPEWWSCVPGILGLPVEYANPPLKFLPWVT